MRGALAASLVMIAGCAQTADPITEQDYAFSVQPDETSSHFRLTYFGQPGGEPNRMAPNGAIQPARDGDTVPGQGALINEHQLFLLLEQQLDQRQLCLHGYRITQRRPTRRGVTLEGHCRPPLTAPSEAPDAG
ncbi:hypothetical protein [Ferrimonas pelagia]|uniref:Lipoprotein n=1 Tax=Ferrimonas pelagia TaxID=1177826 RepID=A0ABP9FDQ0_9GAMM